MSKFSTSGSVEVAPVETPQQQTLLRTDLLPQVREVEKQLTFVNPARLT